MIRTSTGAAPGEPSGQADPVVSPAMRFIIAVDLPVLVVGDAPGPGYRRRALVVMDLRDFRDLHGELGTEATAPASRATWAPRGAHGRTPAVSESSDVLTVKEAAALARVSPATIRRWCRRGYLRAFQVGRGAAIRIPADALRELLARDRP